MGLLRVGAALVFFRNKHNRLRPLNCEKRKKGISLSDKRTAYDLERDRGKSNETTSITNPREVKWTLVEYMR